MERSPSPDLFRILEGVLPDLRTWQFFIEATSAQSVVDWLHQEDHVYNLPQPTVTEQTTVTQTEVFSEFFPNIGSVHSFSPCSSNYSCSSDGRIDSNSPPEFIQEIIPQNWVPHPFAMPSSQYRSHNGRSSSRNQIPLQQKNIRVKEKLQDVCSNCKTTESTMWRWNTKNGGRECNACNLYEVKNGIKRPEIMFKDRILKRNRKNPKKTLEYENVPFAR